MRNTHNPIPQAVWLVLGLGVLAMAWRFLPHAPNLAPVAALALFAAWMTGRAWLGAALAVGIMAVSDAVVGFYDLRVQAVVWTALALPALFARIVPKGAVAAFPWALLAALGGAGAFFVLTNFAVWAFGSMYPHTPAGLAECYLAAVPFFRATLLGDVFWTSVLFGGAALSSLTLRGARVLQTRFS